MEDLGLGLGWVGVEAGLEEVVAIEVDLEALPDLMVRVGGILVERVKGSVGRRKQMEEVVNDQARELCAGWS